jgi:hypothetical protein
MSDIAFNQVHLNAWTTACTREGDLRRRGASEVEIKAAKLDVITTMLVLLAPHMSQVDLARTLIACLVVSSESVPLTDPEYESDGAATATDSEEVEVPD